MPHTEIAEIRELFRHYETTLYSGVRNEQRIDDEYINDTFPIPEIKDPHKVYRNGIGGRMVEAPAEQLVTRNPQIFVGSGNQETAKRLQPQITDWIDVLRRQNPNPFKETVKNPLGRGEVFIQVVHNEDWVTDQKVRVGPPVLFIIPDPMVIYASPAEDANGIPLELFVKYERQVEDVIYRYPDWTNPKQREADGGQVQWMEYWTPTERYFEADEEAVLPTGEVDASDNPVFGVQKNIYGFVPFVRRYSGFGRRAWDGKLESLIVSDIKYSRDLIRELTATRSDVASILHLFAHRPVNIIIPDDSEVDSETVAEALSLGAYDVNILKLPPGSEFKDFPVLAPTAEMFQHIRDIKNEIIERNPFVSPGPIGSSGRQQDLSNISAKHRYETVTENIETLWATAFEMALRILDAVPTLAKEAGLTKADVQRKDTKLTVRLMADDPVERDRLATLGSRLWNSGNGEISLRKNLIEYQGMSPDEAEENIVEILVDKVTLFSPEWALVVGREFAREAGLTDAIEEAQALQADQAQSQKALNDLPPSTTQRIQGETQTQTGFDMIDASMVSKGARRPPADFTRGS